MSTRRFAPIFWCQLLSALNDNLVKNTLDRLGPEIAKQGRDVVEGFAKDEEALADQQRTALHTAGILYFTYQSRTW